MFFFTQHAVERFRERWAPGISHPHAIRELKLLASQATRLKERTRQGQEQWLLNDGSGCVLVVKRDPGRPGAVCVTVLPEPERVVVADPPE